MADRPFLLMLILLSIIFSISNISYEDKNTEGVNEWMTMVQGMKA